METNHGHVVRNDMEHRMKSYLFKDEQTYLETKLFVNIPIDTKRKAAMKDALESTIDRLKEQQKEEEKEDQEDQDEEEDDDDDDCEDTYGYGGGIVESRSLRRFNENSDMAKAFIKSLEDCPMILGFHAVMTHGSADQCCYCPCSQKLQPWRTYHNLDVPLCGGGKFDPNGFVAHLKAINDNGTATYHRMVLCYLNALYNNYLGPNIHHRGLYNVNAAEHKKALAEEKKQDVKMICRLQEDINKAQQQKIEADERAADFKNRWEEIVSMKTNPEIEELKKMYDEKMDCLVQLGLAVKTESGQVEIIGKQTKPLTKKDIQNSKALLDDYIELWKLKFQKDDHHIMKQKLQIQYDDRGENPISNWFNNPRSTFLFDKSIINKEGVVGNFFEQWDLKFICYTNPTKKFKTEYEVIDIEEEEDAIEAIDKGGPTRNFLSQLWSQISRITITLPVDGNERRIFEDFGEYVVPIQDPLPLLLLKANPYYRAVGRIIAYCILNEELIANHVLPGLFKNYLLRNISPLNAEYDLTDLIDDFFEMIKLKRESQESHDERMESVLTAYGSDEDDPVLEDSENMSRKEKRFRKCIYDAIFKNRKAALDAIKQGIRLEGHVPCERCFSVVPLNAVKKLLFDDGGYDLNFVLSRMEPFHEFGESEIDATAFLDTQNKFFLVSSNPNDREGTFVNILRKKCAGDIEFIRDFVWFVTGSRYIRQSDFKIIVEFNYTENLHDDSLPIVHTCANTIKFPALVYDNDAEKLEEKLGKAMENVKKCAFDMG